MIMNPYDEFIKAFELVAEYDAKRTVVTKEYRIYYNDDGTILGLWESGFPPGENFIVIDSPDQFHKHNTNWLRVVNKELKIIDPHAPNRVKLKKSITGQRVIKGHAALPLFDSESFENIEYYDRNNS